MTCPNGDIRRCRRILSAALLLGMVLLVPAGAQPAAEEPSKGTELARRVVLSETTERPLRRESAENLYHDPAGRASLVEILTGADNTDAKVIICEVIAAVTESFPTADLTADIPPVFFDPLFAQLGAEPQISACAAQALANCRNGVTDKLEAIVADPQAPSPRRLAALSALELRPGKDAVVALARLLTVEDTAVAQRAAKTLGARLGQAGPIDAATYQNQYAPVVDALSDEAFLRWQISLEQRQIRSAHAATQDSQAQAGAWRDKYLAASRREFERRQGAERLAFLDEQLADNGDSAVHVWVVEQIEAWARTGLGNNGLATQVAQFLVPFVADADPQVRRLAAVALGHVNDKGKVAADALAQQLAKETSPPAQVAQLKTLGAFQYTAVAQQALRLLGSAHEGVAVQAARTLSQILAPGTTALEQALLDQVAQTVAPIYNEKARTAAIRTELIGVMRRLAGPAGYRDLFQPILQGALADDDGVVRRAALEALTAFCGPDVVPMAVGQRNLLEDPDTRVRYTAISVLEQYGNRDALDKLRGRLTRESEADVTKAILDACREILDRLAVTESAQWISQLKAAEGPEQTLYRNGLQVVVRKIAEEREAGAQVPNDIIESAYDQSIDLALADERSADALRVLAVLLKVDLPADRQAAYLSRALKLTLTHAADTNLLADAAQQLRPHLNGPHAPALLGQIAQVCDALPPEATGQKAHLLTQLIVPVADGLPAEQKPAWTKRRTDTARVLLEQQKGVLLGADQAAATAQAQLLQALDSRLAGFPPSADAQQRQKWFTEKTALLAPPLPKAEPTPKPEPTPQPKPTPQPEPAQPAPAAN